MTKYIPSLNFLWVIAHKGVLVINFAFRTASLLWLDSVAADVELLAVLRVREGGVGEGAAVRSHDIAVGARETVV